MRSSDTGAPIDQKWEIPINLQYVLSTDDIYDALKTSPKYRKNIIKAIIETCILGGLTGLFMLWWILWDDGNAMIFCITFALLIALVWAVMALSIRINSSKFNNGKTVDMMIYDDKIIINGTDVFPLDGSQTAKERNKVLILYTGENEWTLIPLKSIPQPDLVKKHILDNTRRPGK